MGFLHKIVTSTYLSVVSRTILVCMYDELIDNQLHENASSLYSLSQKRKQFPLVTFQNTSAQLKGSVHCHYLQFSKLSHFILKRFHKACNVTKSKDEKTKGDEIKIKRAIYTVMYNVHRLGKLVPSHCSNESKKTSSKQHTKSITSAANSSIMAVHTSQMIREWYLKQLGNCTSGNGSYRHRPDDRV